MILTTLFLEFTMKKYVLPLCVFLFFLTTVAYGETSSVFHLDGSWKIVTDPENKGRNENWFNSIRSDAVDVELPNVMQTVFPRYYGLVWYWKEFTAPTKINSENRFLLRFERIDYYTEVWLNGKKIGSHEIGETPFEFDVTNEIQPNGINLLAVRVLNPTNEPIDNITLNNTPKGPKTLPFISGSWLNYGGITGHVELVQVPVVHVKNIFLDAKINGTIQCFTTVANAAPTPQIRNIS
jgi:beta-glucuronidase